MLRIPKPLIIAMSANGPKRTKRDHLFLPVKLAELQASALEARASGAALFSCAPRDRRGLASLDKAVCKETVAALRETLEESALIQLEPDLTDMGAVESCAAF